MQKRDLVAQWIFDTQAVLNRFQLSLDDVEVGGPRAEPGAGDSFVGASLVNSMVLATAVTSLGTWLFGGYGDADGGDKDLNRVKKGEFRLCSG